MKKLFKSLAVVIALMMTVVTSYAAETADYSDEACQTASYVIDEVLSPVVLADDYYASYNDVIDTLLCIKAGICDVDIMQAIEEQIEAQLEDYDPDTFLFGENDYASADKYAYCLAAAILYMEECGEEASDELLELFEKTYLENDITAYGLQYVAGVIENFPEYDWEKVEEKLSSTVKSYIIDNGDTAVVALWGSADYAMVDDQGQTIIALLHVAMEDDDVAEAIDKIGEWIKTNMNDEGLVVSAWTGEGDVDGTALALKFFALTGDEEMANLCFEALLTFESADVEGFYDAGYSPVLATIDALSGLRAVEAMDFGESFFEYQGYVEFEDEDDDDYDDEELIATDPIATPGESIEGNDITNKGDVTPEGNNTPSTGDNGVAMLALVMVASFAGFVSLRKAK